VKGGEKKKLKNIKRRKLVGERGGVPKNLQVKKREEGGSTRNCEKVSEVEGNKKKKRNKDDARGGDVGPRHTFPIVGQTIQTAKVKKVASGGGRQMSTKKKRRGKIGGRQKKKKIAGAFQTVQNQKAAGTQGKRRRGGHRGSIRRSKLAKRALRMPENLREGKKKSRPKGKKGEGARGGGGAPLTARGTTYGKKKNNAEGGKGKGEKTSEKPHWGRKLFCGRVSKIERGLQERN